MTSEKNNWEELFFSTKYICTFNFSKFHFPLPDAIVFLECTSIREWKERREKKRNRYEERRNKLGI